MLAVAASVTSLGNLFAYDSIPIIRENPDVHTLAAPWELFARQYWPPPFMGLYRPLSILWFRLQWLVGGGDPWLFHAVSMALSAVTTLVVYALGRRIFPATVAWIAAALFAVHPVHVESIALAINQSEIMVTLLLTASVALYIRARQADVFSVKTAATITLFYLMACFTKEQGIVLPGLLLAAEITVVQDRRPWRQRLPTVRLLYLILTLVASIYLFARGHALGGTPLAAAVVRPHQPAGRLPATGDHDGHVVRLPPASGITHPGLGGDCCIPGSQATSGNHSGNPVDCGRPVPC
jgi:4-amino-4-deoxy-L-arabinose transferase-like glycosyltransferase